MSNLALTDARVRGAPVPAPPPTTSATRSSADSASASCPRAPTRFFLHIQHRGQRVWHIVGDANAMPVSNARTQAASMLAAIRFGADAQAHAPSFETVADTVFRRYVQVWKPQTLYVNRSYYRCTLAPWFGGQSIADIGPPRMSSAGSPRCAQRPCPPTAPCPCCRSS